MEAAAQPMGWVASLSAVLQPISDILWGWPTIILLMLTGVYLMLVLGFVPLLKLPYGLWQLVAGPRHDSLATGTISNRAALWTALAATVGTGNIAGVATAITLGGPGAVFWMWVSGFLGLALKYAETSLGVHYRTTTQVKQPDGTTKEHIIGGPMLYLKHGARLPSLGMFYAVALGFAAFSVGAMVQSNSMADVMATSFGIPPLWLGAVITLIAAAVMLGGLQRIANAANILVPSMIGLFVLTGTVILMLNADHLGATFALIFHHAFAPAAAGGGFAGAAVAAAMRYGLARGIFSNESGLGSAAVVAAAAKTRHPAEQGFIAMTQTFIDTLVVCTFTALVILVSGAWQAEGLASGGAALSAFAFDAGLGFISIGAFSVGNVILALCLSLFIFTTILGWGYYGQQGAVYAFGQRIAKPYLYVYLGLVFMGAAVLEFAASIREGVALVWMIADITVALMLIPNLIALLILAPTVRRLTRDWLRHLKTGEPLRHAAFHSLPERAVKAATKPVAAAKPSKPLAKKAAPVAKAKKKAKSNKRAGQRRR
ncbi:MAG: alanine/glycine:cation symporter family protein [Pseudomonadota bacterium]